MKQEQARVLAYCLAKEVDNAELDKISGGAGGIGGVTQSWTAYPTGSVQAMDGQLDASIDW